MCVYVHVLPDLPAPFPLHRCSLVPCFKKAHVGYCEVELVGPQENMRGRLARFCMLSEPRDGVTAGSVLLEYRPGCLGSRMQES